MRTVAAILKAFAAAKRLLLIIYILYLINELWSSYNKLMQILATSLENCPIFSLQSGRVIGFIKSIIIDPNILKVVVFRISLPGKNKPLFLLADLVIASNKNIISIRREEDVSKGNDLLRQKKFIDEKVTLFRYLAMTQGGQRIGRIEDYRFENQTFYITKLHVKINPLQRLWLSNRIVDREDIIEVKNKKVIIKDGLSKSQIRLKSTLPVKNT